MNGYVIGCWGKTHREYNSLLGVYLTMQVPEVLDCMYSATIAE